MPTKPFRCINMDNILCLACPNTYNNSQSGKMNYQSISVPPASFLCSLSSRITLQQNTQWLQISPQLTIPPRTTDSKSSTTCSVSVTIHEFESKLTQTKRLPFHPLHLSTTVPTGMNEKSMTCLVFSLPDTQTFVAS